MFRHNLKRGTALVALALGVALLGAAPSYAATDNVGMRTTKISSSDQETSKTVTAVSAPTQGAGAVTVDETINYLHKGFWWWSHDQAYSIHYNGSAEFVNRLNYWMMKDVDGSFYRFNAGSTAGIQTAKPTVDIGARSSVISSSDNGFIASVTAGAVSGDLRTLNVSTKYTHVETYDDATYTVPSTTSATFVNLQNAYMAWIGSALYEVDQAGNVKALSEKPTVNVGVRTAPYSGNDQSVSWQPNVSAGQVSFDGQTRNLIVSRDYVHDETFQRLRYTLQSMDTATFVPDQNAYMDWIGNNLYRVRVGSNDVYLLDHKPVVSVGARIYKIDSADPMVSVQVTPVSLTSDNRSIVVNVRRVYRHNETFETKEYYGESNDIATYNANYRVWTVLVDGRIYAIAFDGDVVSDPSVTVVQAPYGLHHPDVMVVPSNNGEDPPVVVPTKNRPVVDPGSDNNDPPVVVPSRHAPAVSIDNGDGGPAVVIPHR